MSLSCTISEILSFISRVRTIPAITPILDTEYYYFSSDGTIHRIVSNMAVIPSQTIRYFGYFALVYKGALSVYNRSRYRRHQQRESDGRGVISVTLAFQSRWMHSTEATEANCCYITSNEVGGVAARRQTWLSGVCCRSYQSCRPVSMQSHPYTSTSWMPSTYPLWWHTRVKSYVDLTFERR